MKAVGYISDTIKKAPSALLVVLGCAVLFLWADRSNLKWELEELTLREIHLTIENVEGEKLKEASINVLPMYSFDEIKPKHTVTFLGDGMLRLSVVFSMHFKMTVGASGYRTQTIEYDEYDSADVTVRLKPL